MSKKIDKILAEISVGELYDKISILEIKKSKIRDNNKLLEIEKELNSLNSTLKDHGLKKMQDSYVAKLIQDLTKVNLELWEIENGKRLAEKNQKFDENFIQLSRNVYKRNDKRAKIKLRINQILGSNIKEVKSHY